MRSASVRSGVDTGWTWCCDHNKVVEYWPKEDGLVEILVEERQGGGPGCNLAVDLRKLDPEFFVETIGLVGDDDDGRLLIAEADAHGINRDQLHITRDRPTNYTDAYSSRRTGRRTHIFQQGVSSRLSPDHFDFKITRGRILHLGLPGIHRTMDGPWADEPNGWVAVLKNARSAGLATNMELASVDPSTLARLVRPCLAHLDFLIVNDVEIGSLTGQATHKDGVTDVEAVTSAANAVLETGAMQVVVVHFPLGAVAIQRSGQTQVRPSVRVPPAEVTGANGAGDAFAAGVLYGLHEGWALEDALKLGHAAAAASLRGVGTTETVGPWRECLRLAEQWGWREAVV